MSRPKVLIVVSSHERGWYLPELAHPYEVLSPHCDIVIASPEGGNTIMDPKSVELYKEDKVCMDFQKTKEDLWEKTEKLESFIGRAKEFDAIFYVGGFGPMFDLPDDSVSIQLIREFHDEQRIVSSVCHGAAALLNVTLANGSLLLAGKAVTGFSDQEEFDYQAKGMPFHLEEALMKASGGHYDKAAKAWDSKVVVNPSGKFLTGQNPASAYGVASELLKLLEAK